MGFVAIGVVFAALALVWQRGGLERDSLRTREGPALAALASLYFFASGLWDLWRWSRGAEARLTAPPQLGAYPGGRLIVAAALALIAINLVAFVLVR